MYSGREASTVVAVGRMERGTFVADSVGYWRLLAGPEGVMVSVAPVQTCGDPEEDQAEAILLSAGPEIIAAVVEMLDRLGGSASSVLRGLYGRATPEVSSLAELLERAS